MVSPIHIIEAVAFVDFLGVGLFVPLLMIRARKIGGSHIQVGLLRSVYSTFQLGSGPLIGSLSDLKGRKPILTLTLVMSSLCYIVMGFTTSIHVILFMRALLGLVKQTQMLTKAMVADYVKNKHEQEKIYGTLMAVSGAGMTLGPVLGGYVEETFPERGFSVISIVVGICFIFNAGLILLLPNPERRSTRCEHQSSRSSRNNRPEAIERGNVIIMFFRSLQQSFLALYNIEWSKYGDIFIFKGLIGFAMGVYYAIYAAFLKEQYELTPKYIGGIISFQSIIGSMSCCFICFINSFYTHDNDYSIRTFHVFILLASAYLGLIFASNILIYLLFLVPLAIGNSVSRLITLEMVLNRTHGSNRGKLIGASNSVASLSGVASPMVAGMIGEWVGVGYVIYASLLSTSLGIILSFNNKKKSRPSVCCDMELAEFETPCDHHCHHRRRY